MLVITQKQMEMLETAAIERFAKECVLFLRKSFASWTQARSEDELGQFVREIIEFSREHGIEMERNIQKIMELKICHDFQLPLPERLQFTLFPSDTDEDYRMERFIKALDPQIDSLIQISLDSDTQLLKKEYTRYGTGKWQW